MTMTQVVHHLTLPLSDFSTSTSSAGDDDNDDLVLVSLSSSSEKNNGGLTMNDLLNSNNSVYILGDTCESDIAHSSKYQHQGEEGGDFDGNKDSYRSSSFEPVAARLIVEPNHNCHDDDSKKKQVAKTLELIRVETSNTYIVTPPFTVCANNNNDDDTTSHHQQQGDCKRQKLSSSNSEEEEEGPTQRHLVTMPARSIGVIPGENSPSCFFLEPVILPPGHFATKLRGALSRWVFDPLEPHPSSSATALLGYTTRELAHICRSSLSEIEDAISNRVFGAEDALVIPYVSNSDHAEITRYGMLSEEGRQTVTMAIVSSLLESDLDLAWSCSDEGKTIELSSLMQEVRLHWQREEGADNELADEVIWHGLRPIIVPDKRSCVGSTDEMPKQVQLIADEVAKLAAHHVFLRGTPRSSARSSTQGVGSGSAWEEDEFMEAWSLRLPTMKVKYRPSLESLKGIAISEMIEDKRQWRYFPASGLPLNPSLRVKSMLAIRKKWSLEEAKPYLENLTMNETEIADLLKTQKK